MKEYNPDLGDIKVEKSIVTTGIMSPVYSESEMNFEIMHGHVLMFDFEDTKMEIVEDYHEYLTGDERRDDIDLPIMFIFQSSEGNFHGLCPIIDSYQEALEIKSQHMLDDQDHVEVGMKKGRWTLRVSEKGDKPAPQYIGYVINENANLRAGYTWSQPHLEFLVDNYDVNIAKTIIEECKTAGESLDVVKYHTRENNHG